MSEEVRDVIRTAEKAMQKALESLENDFHQIRTGRASTTLVERLPIEYYDSHVPLQQLAALSVPEAQLILIRPFDPTTIKLIEKAILTSDLKLNPSNDGKVIRLAIPPLTVERRKEIVKVVHRRLEEAKVSLRNARHEGMDLLKEYEKEDMISEDDHTLGKKQLDDLIHKCSTRADELSARKEKEVMEN